MSLEIRKCAKCGEDAMHQSARKMGLGSVDQIFVCRGCGHTVAIAPQASIGFFLMAYVVFLILMYLMFDYKWGWSTGEIITFGVFLALGAWTLWYQLRDSRANPVVGQSDASELPPASALTRFMEGGSMLIGILTPFIFAAGVLLVAALIGMWNDGVTIAEVWDELTSPR